MPLLLPPPLLTFFPLSHLHLLLEPHIAKPATHTILSYSVFRTWYLLTPPLPSHLDRFRNVLVLYLPPHANSNPIQSLLSPWGKPFPSLLSRRYDSSTPMVYIAVSSPGLWLYSPIFHTLFCRFIGFQRRTRNTWTSVPYHDVSSFFSLVARNLPCLALRARVPHPRLPFLNIPNNHMNDTVTYSEFSL